MAVCFEDEMNRYHNAASLVHFHAQSSIRLRFIRIRSRYDFLDKQ